MICSFGVLVLLLWPSIQMSVELRDGGTLAARDYQIRLFEQALGENVIVWLETGSGKTFIALLLMKELCHETCGKYRSEKGGRRTVFVVNSVALAKQQTKYIEHHSNLKVDYFTGLLVCIFLIVNRDHPLQFF